MHKAPCGKGAVAVRFGRSGSAQVKLAYDRDAARESGKGKTVLFGKVNFT